MTKRFFLLALLIVVVIAAVVGWKYYRWIYHPNTTASSTEPIVLVRSGTSLDMLTAQLTEQAILVDEKAFRWVAHRMKFKDTSILDGRYLLDTAMSNYDLIHKLRLGEQEPIDLIIRTAWNVNELSGKIAAQLAMDSIQLVQEIMDVYLPTSRYTPETILSLFIPNTYEVYWNVTPAGLVERLEQEHNRFWEPRRAKAKDLNLTDVEIYTLASILERETQANDEKATIAGVYLNRLDLKMRLEADPTVLFALGDFSIRRVLNKHLKVKSPYNTYLNQGLPPGPITMASIASLDAVLNAEEHDFLFFCAKPGYDGHHSFASTLLGHRRNAREYQRWLNKEGIR